MDKYALRNFTLISIITQLNAGTLGATDKDGCLYQNKKTGKTCLVGGMLAPQHQTALHNLDMNKNTGVDTLFESLGIDAEALTGFNLKQLEVLQNWHDAWAREDVTLHQFIGILQAVRIQLISKLTTPLHYINALGGKVHSDYLVDFE